MNTERKIITAILNNEWNLICKYFNLTVIPLKIHWSKVYSIKSATGSAVSIDFIRRSKRKTMPYTNITLPDKIEWVYNHIENIRLILIHEALHHTGLNHNKQLDFSHIISKDTYSYSFYEKIYGV